MFIHQSKLPHVLLPEHYSCESLLQREKAELFAPQWHLVGSLADLPNEGDFLTKEIMGTPILIRNSNQNIHGYLNVCPHRHSMLSHQPTGNCQTIKCQYHGWEFTESGKAAKIPDAKSFRPMPGGPECLKKFKTSVVGPLIFANLNPDPLPIANQLGVTQTVIEEFPASRWCRVDRWSYDFPVNWKIVTENTVESYHLDSVHSKTLQAAASEEDIEHEIHASGTVMRSTTIAPAIYRRLADWVLPRLQPGCDHQYQLHHCFPGLFIIRIDAMLQVMTLIPLTETSCHLDVSVFILRAENETRWTRWLTSMWGRLKASVIKKVLAEDAAIYPDLQRGMEHSPFKGSISSREELVFAFQEYIARNCDLNHLISDANQDAAS